MNTFKIFSFISVVLLNWFSHGGGKFQLTFVTYIKEIQSQGEIPQLEENTVANTEEKRLKLCKDGFRQIQKHNLWGVKGKAAFLERTPTEKLKVYFFVEVDNFRRASTAFKCPTDPESYIQMNLNSENNNQPSFEVLCKKNLPPPILGRIMYQMVRVKEIVEVDAKDMISTSKNENGVLKLKVPIYDAQQLTYEQKLQVCRKGMQTVPKLNIELSKGAAKPITTKFYAVPENSGDSQKIMEAFECPTEPKIYISMGQELSDMKGESSKVVLLSVLTKETDDDRKFTSAHDLKAYSSKETAEVFYHQIRDANKGTKIDQIIDLGTQVNMCQLIFKDVIYERCRQEWCPDYRRILKSTYFFDTYDELKKEDATLFERFYKDSDSVFISGQDIVIVNGPESNDVRVSQTQKSVSEDLFVCLIRSDRSNLEEYFFSKEYNVNNTKNSFNDHIAGRFLFKRNPNNSIVMIGMVEEFAKALETSNVELLYLERRKRQDIAETDSDDRLCRLGSFERSRICSLVFDFIFPAQCESPLHHLGCTKNPITFETNDGLKEANDEQYYEWMITCKESDSKNGSFSVHYLSQAYDKSNPSSSNDVFAYNRAPGSGKTVLKKVYSDPRIGSFLTKK